MTDWVTFADELRSVSDDVIGEGSVYREHGGVGPLSSESEWEVTAFEPPSARSTSTTSGSYARCSP